MQIYKFYINEKPLVLMSRKTMVHANLSNKNTLVVQYTGRPKSILQCVDSLEKGTPYDRLVLYADSYRQLKGDVKALFDIVRAGGGLVINEKEEGLFIFRRGHWDLPKGKLDTGESYRVAALREVKEETGIQGVELCEKIGKTRHLFKNKKGQRSLKLVNWYHMKTLKQDLVPEVTEDIEKAVWLDLDDFLKHKKPVFHSIEEIVADFIKMKEASEV